MINAQEIRMGNYFKDHTGRIGKVKSFFEHKVTLKMEFSTEVISTKPEFRPGLDIDPIPLTPEVLEKCGFEDHKMYGWNILNDKLYKRIGVFIDIKEVRIMMPYFNGVMTICNTMQYLHHLQNLIFTLTGEELTVNL